MCVIYIKLRRFVDFGDFATFFVKVDIWQVVNFETFIVEYLSRFPVNSYPNQLVPKVNSYPRQL